MDNTTALIVFVLVAVLIIFWPLALIWSLNTLFPLGIAYTFKTWTAALLISILFGSKSSSKK